MKKRSLFTIGLVILLSFALGMGTLAYFSKDFTSNDNVVRAASFDVSSNGTLDEDHIFDLSDDPIYPGRNMDVYEFEINKNNTEVPVEYDVSVEGIDPLFQGDTPVELTVLRKVGEGWEAFEGTKLVNPEVEENFKINLSWGHTNNDTAYQGKLGKINIHVVATQVDEEVPDPDPDPDPEPVWITRSDVTVTPDYVTGKLSVALKIEIDGEINKITSYGATVEFNGQEHTPRKERFKDGNWMPLYELDVSWDNPFPEKATIRLYNALGHVLYTFEDVPLNVYE